MEPVSLAIGVVPLAVQLGKGIHTLLSLLHSIKDAPSEMTSMIEDAEFLQSLLAQVVKSSENFGNEGDSEIRLALRRCEKSLGDLCTVAESYVSGFESKSGVRRRLTAVSVVRRKQEFAALKARLNDAKLDLLIAQQISGARCSQLQHCANQQSLLELVSGFKEVRDLLSSQEQRVSTRFVEVEGESADAALAVQLQKPFCASSVKASTAFENSMNDILVDKANFSLGSVCKRRMVGFPEHTITWTPMGTLHCSTTMYRSIPFGEDSRGRVSGAAKIDVVKRFNFVPSWLSVKLGISRVMEYISTNSSSQGWQYHLRTFNLVSKSALIFDFCRLGNTEAVKHLIAANQASVNDMNEFGETPLHVAAGHCHADLCDFLLQAGSCRKVRQVAWRTSTPFGRVFFPCSLEQDRLMKSCRITSLQFEQTVRVFLKAGEDFEHAYDDHFIRELIGVEAMNSILGMDHLRPVSWLLEQVMPAINPSILDLAFWDRCMGDAIGWGNTRHPSTRFIMNKCGVESIRTTLLHYLVELREMPPSSETTDDVLLLLNASDGPVFLESLYEKTPISLTLECPRSFAALRTALEASSYDLIDVIHHEVALMNNGWTETKLLALFKDDFELKPGRFDKDYCRACSFCRVYPHEYERITWKRRVRRHKKGLDQDPPFNEAEIQDLLAAEEVAKAYDGQICLRCHGTTIKCS